MRLFRIIAVAAVAILLSHPAHADQAQVDAGRALFLQDCARCHGQEGKGDGPDGKRLYVLPRDLTSGRFKWKTTVQGTPPSDDDIKSGIIGHGLSGTGMPSFSNLSDSVKQSIVEYIKTISPAFKNAQKPEAIPNPKNLKAKPDIKKGGEIYAKLQCALCHGQNGRANGTSAFTLQDAWQRPIRPADLTEGWTYRGGARPIDIYHRMLAGIDGAPMPSYEGAVTHEEAWELSNYVASLQLSDNFSGDVVAEKISGDLPAAANDAAWSKAPVTMVNLQNFLYRDGKRQRMTVNAVSVQALFNDKGVAFRLGWDDPTKSTGGTPDAVLFAAKPVDYRGDPRGNLLNLYDAKDALDFSYWKSARPESVSRGATSIGDGARAGWAGQESPAASDYDDGRWTVVFHRDFADKAVAIRDGKERARISLAAWDGGAEESGLRYSASDWVWLDFGAPAGHH